MKQITLQIETKEVEYTPQDGGYGTYYIKVTMGDYVNYYTLETDGDNGSTEVRCFDAEPQADFDKYADFDFDKLACFAQEKFLQQYLPEILYYATVYNKE